MLLSVENEPPKVHVGHQSMRSNELPSAGAKPVARVTPKVPPAKSEFVASIVPKYSTFFLFVVLASVGLPLLNGFIGEFLVLSGAFQAHMWWGVVGATGIIWSECYLLWMYQRVFFGVVKHQENLTLPDLNLRERVALWPAAIMALAMGIAPLLWLNGIDPAVHNALVPFTQFISKVVSQ